MNREQRIRNWEKLYSNVMVGAALRTVSLQT